MQYSENIRSSKNKIKMTNICLLAENGVESEEPLSMNEPTHVNYVL